jgi:thiamine biosynthesis lipoprotein
MTAVAHPCCTRRVEHVMGTTFVVDVRAEVPAGLVDRVFAWFRFVDETFSTYRHDSEISRIDRGELAREVAHEDVRAVLTECELLRTETDGYFDAWAGGRLDPSGLVKGWSVDRAGAMLEEEGVFDYAIYAGGDLLVRGRPGGGDPWLVGVRHPGDSTRIIAVIAAEDLAIATSAAYARGCHILDPVSGRAAEGVRAVTVTGPRLATADALATAAFAMGARGPRWTTTLDGYEALTIVDDATAFATPGFPAVAA